MLITSPEFIADASVSVFGAFGAMIVLRNLAHIVQSGPVQRGFRFCLWILILLMVVRIGHWGNFGWLVTSATFATASLIPLAGLLLAEVLLRRHAPAALKTLCASGGVVFGLLAFVSISTFEVWYTFGLMLFQLVGLVGVAWFTLARDRASLSLAENNLISQIALCTE